MGNEQPRHPRHVSRYGLPQVPAAAHHQLAKDWLLRNGTSYHEDRELGTKRARAAILMELALPGSAYIYQGEELGLPEVADIPWDELEDPTAFNRVRDQIERAATAAASRCLGRPGRRPSASPRHQA